jgi:hypothetical protein
MLGLIAAAFAVVPGLVDARPTTGFTIWTIAGDGTTCPAEFAG